ncbi:MAG: glycosyltransferase family 2 protein [Lewinella sp.]|uniref:glycosyltransferase family 2 protein n=1 Tax=Lewinella sp. TaxID=2004506 RepID=UPI003D6A7F7C
MARSLSVIITTYNEADNIARCLESILELANDILVVDSFSTDKTVEIARRYPVRVLERKYLGPANQKNWAIPQAKHQWVLLLDADEMATPALCAEIKTLLVADQAPAADAYWIGRDNYFLNQQIRFSGWQGDRVIRFFHRDQARYNELQVHEEIVTDGITVDSLSGRLDHYTFRSLDHYLDKTRRYAHWSAQDHSKRTTRVGYFHLFGKPFFRFFKHFVLQQGFRDGKVGLMVSAIMAWGVFLRYAFLLEQQKNK